MTTRQEQVKVPGAPLYLGDRWFVVPPLSLKQLRTKRDFIAAFSEREKKLLELGGEPTPNDLVDIVTDVAQIVWVALTRNYPELTLEEIEDSIDMGNFKAALQAVMGQSGFNLTRDVPQEQGSAGEGEAMAGSGQ